jgi:hypothetical protein
VTSKTTFSLWQPPTDTLEAIASVLSSRWLAAKGKPNTSFWPDPASWLRQQALWLTAEPITTSPAVAGSSGTLRDPRRY